MDHFDYSVVLPCLNEELTLGECIVEANKGAELSNLKVEIIVADNGSNDSSVKIATALGARVVSVPQRGYGAALDAGIRAAKSDYVLMGDSDCSYNFIEGVGLIRELHKNDVDIVLGNRFKGGIEKGAMPMHHKLIGNPVLSFLGRVFFKIKLGDFHCGLRAVRQSSYLNVAPTTTGMEFATEMIARFAIKGYNFAEIPIHLRKDKRNRKPHLRSFPDGWRHLKMMLLFSPQFFLLFPGILFMGSGLIGLSQYLISGKVNLIVGEGRIQAGLFSLIVMGAGIQLSAAAAVSLAMAEQKKLTQFSMWERTRNILKSRTFFSFSVFITMIGILGLFLIGGDWITSVSKATNPLLETRKTLGAMALILTGVQAMLTSIQVRQILSRFW